MPAEATVDVTHAPEPPHPRALPLVGTLPGLSIDGPIVTFTRLWRRLGDAFVVRAGPRRLFVVVHPDAVERVLVHRRDVYVKGRTYDGMRLLTGNGLLTLEGEAWRVRRRLLQPGFTKPSLARLTTSMTDVTARGLSALRARAPSGSLVDAHQEFLRLTLSIVGEALFGQPVGDDTADASGRAFTEALEEVTRRGNAVVQWPLSVPTPGNRRFRAARALLDDVTAGVIARARGRHAAGADDASLLGQLIAARDEKGAALDDATLPSR